MANKKNNKIKLQFEFTIEQVAELDELVELMEASSRAEVIRRSYKTLLKLVKANKIELI